MATLVQSDEVHRIALTACGNTPGRQAESVRLIDAAYWCKGCSSLGQLRYAVLIAVRDAQGEETPLWSISRRPRLALRLIVPAHRCPLPRPIAW
jgi:uncharacterized protein (DUF2252 family)